MVLKRKRSTSELCSSPSSSVSSTSSSPSHNSPFAIFSSSMLGPAHLNSRTLKRLRNGRPSDEEVHQRTLGLLYSAQQRPSDLQQVLDDQDHSAAAAPTPAATPAAQQSLHRFWNINSTPRAPVPSLNQQTSACLSDCEDCGGTLASTDDGMDIDGDGVQGSACSSCGKNVCFSCSVSNLGEQKRCLRCAGRPVAVGNVGWANADCAMRM